MAGELRVPLHQGSFRGVNFFYRDSNTTGGRKLAEHDFVYSDRRLIQDMGSFPYKFEMTIDIAQSVENYTDGEEYYVIRDRLLDALYKEGKGTLVHPFYGEQDVFCKPFSIREDLKNLGISQLSVEFCVAEDDVTINEVKGSQASVAQLTVSVYNTVQNAITNGVNGVTFYTPPTINPFAYRLLGSSLSGLLSALDTFTQGVNVSQALNSVLSNIQSFSGILPTASLLANKLIEIFSTMSDESETITAQQAFDLNRTAFDYDLLQFYTATGSSNPALETNFSLLDSSIKSLALANMYELAIDYDFLTVDDMQDYLSITSAYYQTLESNVIDFTFVNALNKLRAATRNYLQTLDPFLYKIKDVSIKGSPLEPLVYSYYGNLDLIDTIADLNRIRDYRWLEKGTYKVLSL